MKTKLLYLISVLLITIVGCKNETPVNPDGSNKLVLKALWDSSTVVNVRHIVPLVNAEVVLVSEYGTLIYTTDNNGTLEINNLPAAHYDAAVRRHHPEDYRIILSGVKNSIVIENEKEVYDTIFALPYNNQGITINEIYSFGASQYYYYDQFIELYNSSDSIKYLDGMQVIRFSENLNSGPGGDWDNDGDIDGVTYIFKFPGEPGEKNYPIIPNEFLVLAKSAVDHSLINSHALNLRNADWEFYNQFSAEDSDQPDVKNLINLRPDKSADFYISLDYQVLVLANGVDKIWEDGIDISSVVDGVEYQASMTQKKSLDSRVDKSFILTPPKYSGKSIQRREPGLDTNDGILDWEITSVPSPGF